MFSTATTEIDRALFPHPTPDHKKYPHDSYGKTSPYLDCEGLEFETRMFRTTSSKKWMVWMHGNMEDLTSLDWMQRFVRDVGMNAVCIEYPSYGYQEYDPNYTPTPRDFSDRIEWVVAYLIKNEKPEGITLVGQSMGAAAVLSYVEFKLRLGFLREPGAPFLPEIHHIVLISPFRSAMRAQPMWKTSFARYLGMDRFQNELILQKMQEALFVSRPITCVIHGTDDRVVDYATNAPTMRRLVNYFYDVKGATHTNLFGQFYKDTKSCFVSFLYETEELVSNRKLSFDFGEVPEEVEVYEKENPFSID